MEFFLLLVLFVVGAVLLCCLFISQCRRVEGLGDIYPIRDFKFPVEIAVAAGDTVTWRNDDSAWHTVTSGIPEDPDGSFDSKRLNKGDTFSHTFKQQGSFAYYCRPHPWMTGTVVVQ